MHTVNMYRLGKAGPLCFVDTRLNKRGKIHLISLIHLSLLPSSNGRFYAPPKFRQHIHINSMDIHSFSVNSHTYPTYYIPVEKSVLRIFGPGFLEYFRYKWFSMRCNIKKKNVRMNLMFWKISSRYISRSLPHRHRHTFSGTHHTMLDTPFPLTFYCKYAMRKCNFFNLIFFRILQ